MPLILGDVNTLYTIRCVSGKDDVRAHLKNLGIVENESITIKQAVQGNLIVEIKGVRIALSSALAKRIQV